MSVRLSLTALALALFTGALIAPSAARAQVSFVARAEGGNEVPAVTSSAYGVVYGYLDGAGALTTHAQHNVTGATAAHVHQAAAGANGGVVQAFPSAASPLVVTFTPTAPQVTAFGADSLYVNIHTTANPGGEIRAQMDNQFGAQVYINEYCNDPFPPGGPGLDTNLDGVAATAADQFEDEFVEIVNGTSAPVDLGGWTVADGAMVRHTFGPSTILPPFGAIVVFSGGDLTNFNATPAVGVRASTGLLGFDNGGDTITLADDSGATIDTITYTNGSLQDGNGESVNRTTDSPFGTFDRHTNVQGTLGAFAFPVTTHSPGRFADATFYFAAAVVCGDGVIEGTEQCDDGADNGTAASCCAAGCAFASSTTVCRDGLFCTATDLCDGSGNCVGSGDACDDGVSCTTDVCDEATDACTSTPVDAACDNADVCDGAETCDATLGCQAGTALSCDDSDACNGLETCDATLGCEAGTALVCADTDPCTADSCDTLLGCQHTAITCPDAGVIDAGIADSGMGGTDGGTRADAGSVGPGDGGIVPGDASLVDGAARMDGGTEAPSDGGCSCRAVGSRSRNPLGAVLLLGLVLLSLRRRRAR